MALERFRKSWHVTVYERPNWWRCSKWVGYLQANGFKVEKKDVPESQLDAINAKHGVPPQLSECHTALVESYVIEGHVPVDAIRRLLKEKPPVVGLAVQGMPVTEATDTLM